MKTLRLTADSNGISEAAAIVRRGGLVAFATETVYGLGANALDRDAVVKIFEAKERPSWDPIIVHCTEAAMAHGLVLEWPEEAQKLAEKFWPGPLTMLLPKRDIIPDACTAGRPKVGLRVPSHEIALALIREAGVPIAAPSANRFGHTSPTSAEHVLTDLDGRIDAVLDAGPAKVGVESTVIDPVARMIYRPGGVTREQIQAVIGAVEVAQRPIVEQPAESLESPGLGIRHYAPRAHVILARNQEEFSAIFHELTSEGHRPGLMKPLYWLAHDQLADDAIRYDWGDYNNHEELARKMYEGFRWLDQQGVPVIVCPLPKAEGLGAAICDRLMKMIR